MRLRYVSADVLRSNEMVGEEGKKKDKLTRNS